MMRFSRPAEPSGFARRLRDIDTSQVKVRKIWKLYKRRFAEAQHGRCGYCDRKITDTQHGDVEHYRPKGRVDEIDDPCASDKCLIGEEARASSGRAAAGARGHVGVERPNTACAPITIPGVDT